MRSVFKILLLLPLLMPLRGLGQHTLVVSPGVSYQKEWMGELSLMYATEARDHSGLGIYGPRLGAEFSFSSTNFIWAPKLGFELDVLFLALRANAVSYFDNGNTDLRLLPEVGITFFGLANLMYGYGFPVLSYETGAISRNRVTLTINLSRGLWRDIFGR